MMEQKDTIIDPETGEDLHRGVRKVTFSYKGESIEVDMPGWYALNIMKARVEGLPLPTEIRSIRKKFQLTQEQAGTILGGGARAFQKYESGEVLPSRTMANLLLLLQEYPQGLETLRARRKEREKSG